jgi:predicted amidohydrolase
MRLCVAQIRPVKGNIDRNIEKHEEIVASASSYSASAIIFPELSLTGYEPTLARELACDASESRFDVFQRIADDKEITIGIGAPTRNEAGNCISMILYQPHQRNRIYSKKHLHHDEEPFFVAGENFNVFTIQESNIAPAICYEISVPQHAENASANGADFYIASVNKSVTAIDAALKRLAEIARKYSMTVLMSNCVGFCDGSRCAGKTSIWNDKGLIIGQLDDRSEGLLFFDTVSQIVIERRIG